MNSYNTESSILPLIIKDWSSWIVLLRGYCKTTFIDSYLIDTMRTFIAFYCFKGAFEVYSFNCILNYIFYKVIEHSHCCRSSMCLMRSTTPVPKNNLIQCTLPQDWYWFLLSTIASFCSLLWLSTLLLPARYLTLPTS